MNIMQRLHEGFSYAVSSMLILWHNPKFLAYRGVIGIYQLIASTLQLPLQLSSLWAVALVVLQDPTNTQALTQLSFIHHISAGNIIAVASTLFFALISSAMVIFANAALSHHTMHTMHYQTRSIIDGFRSTLEKWRPLLMWSGIVMIIEALLTEFVIVIAPYTRQFTFIVFLTWLCIALLVIPVIMGTHQRFNYMLRLAYQLTKRSWAQILGGFTTIAVCGTVLWLLIQLLLVVVPQSAGLAFLILTFIIGTVRIIFATVLYMRFYQEPLEELQALQHTDF